MEGSVLGLARLGSRLLRGRIISQAQLTAMNTRPGSNSASFGWVVSSHERHNYFEKRGDQDGARSLIRIYPDDDLVIVFMGNTRGLSTTLQPPIRDIANAIF